MFRTLVLGSMVALLTGMGGFASCSDHSNDSTRSVALAVSGHLTGAVFTTTSDGSRVNANLYPSKQDVYLDGGPGPNAPASAAGLPEGDYYFQVTDPSGKDLLSTDHISCRKVHVNAAGVIDDVYAGINYVWVNKDKAWVPQACQHEEAVDRDHFELGAITVQLFPYDDTPNRGGVYKVWMTRTGDYAGDPLFVPSDRHDAVNGEGWEPANAHGFIPAYSKTDNYKVREKGPPCDAPVVTVHKFHDMNMNGVQDTGDADISGWGMTVAYPDGSSNQGYTPLFLTGAVGDWAVVEDTPDGTTETVSILDGVAVSSYPDADPAVLFNVASECGGEEHEVVFGNVGVGTATACKVYDRNGNGVADDDEPGVPGWKMVLRGVDVRGDVVSTELVTGADGCVDFGDLLPGTYALTEMMPTTGGWSSTGDTTTNVTIESTLTGGDLAGTTVEHAFTNVCTGTAAFGTKGYWHNKNGLAEITGEDVEYANGLAPYATESSYFGAGDEPFDGLFSDGTPVAEAQGPLGDTIAAAGTALAEISQFLVDSNATGDPREQLAQQLLAFVMNTQHRLDGPDAAIKLPDGTFQTAGAIIDEAIAAWESGGSDANGMSQLLDGFNNSSAVEFVYGEPCSVTYP